MVPGELNKLLSCSQILAMLISLQSLLRHLSSGNSLLLSDILRLTGIAPPALNPKSLEPQHQATASQRRKPKISRAPHWGAPRRRPPRTCPRTGHQWGTRRKVKRWTTNWLRQKSKNHLALLLLLFLISGGKNKHRGCKIDQSCRLYSYLSLFRSLSSLLCSVFQYAHILPVCPLSLPLCTVTIDKDVGWDMTCQHSSHLMLYCIATVRSGREHPLPPPFDATHHPHSACLHLQVAMATCCLASQWMAVVAWAHRQANLKGWLWSTEQIALLSLSRIFPSPFVFFIISSVFLGGFLEKMMKLACWIWFVNLQN